MNVKSEKRIGAYEHPAITELITKHWFSQAKSDGAVVPSFFNPIPLSLIAFAATVVNHFFHLSLFIH